MINVIQCDDPRALELSLYPEQNYANIQYIQSQMANFGQNLTETGYAYMQQYQQHYMSIDHNEIARKARQATRAMKSVFETDTVVPLESIERIQLALPVMQTYIMANPMLRAYYHQNKADGYADTYVDMEPGRIGENHTAYRKVMTGHLEQNEDTGAWTARQHLLDLQEGDTPLGVDQRFMIRRVWRIAEDAMRQGIDPSNPFGGELGV